MKLKIYLSLLIITAIGLQSCDKEEDLNMIPSELTKAFSERFPNTGHVEWEKQKNFYVAEFHNKNNQETDVWFTFAYEWHMTQTDISFSLLPEAIQKAFNQSEYATWQIDDVDKIEKVETSTFYTIEVEQGTKNKWINIDTNGHIF